MHAGADTGTQAGNGDVPCQGEAMG